jgi:hypothetical protein
MTYIEKEKLCKSLPITLDMVDAFEEYKKKYSGGEDGFKIQYYQGIIDIEGNILQIGQTVHYIFGKYLHTGPIEDILPFKVGCYDGRLKMKGKKYPISSIMMVLKK